MLSLHPLSKYSNLGRGAETGFRESSRVSVTRLGDQELERRGAGEGGEETSVETARAAEDVPRTPLTCTIMSSPSLASTIWDR
jgi:hypothetical protein